MGEMCYVGKEIGETKNLSQHSMKAVSYFAFENSQEACKISGRRFLVDYVRTSINGR